jgi:hypothetical protein
MTTIAPALRRAKPAPATARIPVVMVEAVTSRTCVNSTSVTPLVGTVVPDRLRARDHETASSRGPPATRLQRVM